MMIKELHIKNFRCFKNTLASGFKNINLIGGTNNAGKTALLEAILLTYFPSPGTISILRELRNESDSMIAEDTERVWNYFFYQQEKDNQIELTSKTIDDLLINININCINDIKSVIDDIVDTHSDRQERISDLLQSKFSNTTLLHINGGTSYSSYNYYLLPDKDDADLGAIGKTPSSSEIPPFIHSTFRLNDKRLTSLYSKTKEKKKINSFNNILKLIDKTIIGSEIDTPGGEPKLNLLLDDETSLPLDMFGDAVRKIAEISLVLLNTTSPIILIDEIENGIHFTKHKEVWSYLFDIIGDSSQIFATSHSAEMIKAFNDMSFEKQMESRAMYFEMSRLSSSKIIVNPIDMDMLRYEIRTNNSYRGE